MMLISKEKLIQDLKPVLDVSIHDHNQVEYLFQYINRLVNTAVNETVINYLHPDFGVYHQLSFEERKKFLRELTNEKESSNIPSSMC